MSPSLKAARRLLNRSVSGSKFRQSFPAVGQKSRMRIEIKSVADDGTFDGILSPYGNVDDGGDVVEKGAYTKTLKERGSTVPLLWQHKTDMPIGQLSLTDTSDGLACKGKLLLDVPKAKEAYLLIKAGIVKGLSIGFETIKDSIQDGIRHLKEIKLYEGSVVTFPMNEMALITSVKAGADGPNDFNDELAEIQLWDLPYQLINALQCAFAELYYCSGLSKDEMLSGFQTVLAQFSDAYMAFLPDYLDAMNERYGGMECWERHVLELKSKGKTSRVDGEDLTADCFLIVGDPEDTSTWKLPWKFSTDDKTKSHLRNALARFSQLTGVSDADLAKAKKKLISLCDKYGIEVSDDFKKSAGEFDVKKGARHSADTKDAIMAACKQIKAGHDDLLALIDGEAGDDDNDQNPDDDDGATSSDDKAAKAKSEPGNPHSALLSTLDELAAVLSE